MSVPRFSRGVFEANGRQKYGRPNEATPAKWSAEYKDFTAPLQEGTVVPSKQIEAPDAAPGADEMQTESALPPEPRTAEPSPKHIQEEVGSPKKRKRHEGETAEERAERKRKKKEKKEKRKGKSDGDSE